jgi:uncharacterized membrane protein required for colicin V production
MFGLVDIILAAIVILFIIGGLVYGFIKTLGNLIGTVVGIWLASFVVAWMNESFSLGFFTIATIFIVVTMLVSYIVGWVFDFFDGMYRILSIIPFLKSINKLLGGALGFVEGVIFVIALQIFSQLYFAETSIGKIGRAHV